VDDGSPNKRRENQKKRNHNSGRGNLPVYQNPYHPNWPQDNFPHQHQADIAKFSFQGWCIVKERVDEEYDSADGSYASARQEGCDEPPIHAEYMHHFALEIKERKTV
jgi:hypothetical protein